MTLTTGLTGVILLTVIVSTLYQWLLDSPLFEFWETSRSPRGGTPWSRNRVVHTTLSGIVPVTAMIIATVIVMTMPFRIWAWSVVVLLAATIALSPIFVVYHYDVRPLTREETTTVRDALPDLDCEVVVITNARDNPVNGYAIGGPFRDVVGISEFALTHLPPYQVAALLAHEICHHRQRHVFIRGGVSVAILVVGTIITTTLFSSLTTLATLYLVITITVERVVSYKVMRLLEYQADANAAKRTSVDAVTCLLRELDTTAGSTRTWASWFRYVFSSHPPYPDRIERLQRQTSRQIDGGGTH